MDAKSEHARNGLGGAAWISSFSLASRSSPICRSHSIACEPLPIAVFGFPGLGDLVRCHSLIQMIAERNPDRPIDLIARRSVVAIGAFMPQIRDTIGDDFRHNYLTMGSRLALAKKLRNRGYGSAYIIQSSFKAALVPFLARIPERIGWADEGRRPLLTRPRFGLRRLPRMVDRMCWLGVADGEEAPAKWPEPRLQVPDFHQTQLKVLRESRPKMAPVVAIAPGSSVLSKNWPVENYAAIARRCVKVGCTVWIVGSSGHRELAAAISECAPARDCLTNSVAELAVTIAAADVFIGNDSGPLHIAAAFGKPSIGVFGSHDIDSKAPINAAVSVVAPELAVAKTSTTEFHWPLLDPVVCCLDRVIEFRENACHDAARPPGGGPSPAGELKNMRCV